MITELMNGFLNYSPEQAEAFLQLLSIEKQWKTQYHKEEELKPENIKTKADLFKFIQAIGQSQWFKGHDRLRYEVDISKDLKKDEYFKLFKSIGLIDKVSYNSDEAGGPPNFSVVLGAYQLGVETRVNTLIEDYKNGIRPTEDIIIGLGCNRKLDSTIESITNDLRDSDPNKKPTEMDMMNFVIEEAIEENQLEGIKYEPVSTSSEAKTRADESCVKTSDTAVSLKGYLENYLLNKSIDDPIKLVVYSHQPFIERQKVDMESRLPKNHKVYCVGNEITSEDFKKSPTIVVLCLAEIARYINTKFIEKHQYIEGDLSEEQRQEIDLLTRDNTKENKVGTSIQELSVEHPSSYRVK